MRANGRIDYVELPATDLAAAKRFYAEAFGWSFTDYGPSYSAFGDAGLDGGLQADPAERPAAPLVVIRADDLEAMEARVRAAGAPITTPPFPFPGGRRFHFRDPSGVELAVVSYDQGG